MDELIARHCDLKTTPSDVLRCRQLCQDCAATALRAFAEKEKELVAAIVWALGYTDFRHREEGEGAYWWRKELRERAGLPDEDCRAVLSKHKVPT